VDERIIRRLFDPKRNGASIVREYIKLITAM